MDNRTPEQGPPAHDAAAPEQRIPSPRQRLSGMAVLRNWLLMLAGFVGIAVLAQWILG